MMLNKEIINYTLHDNFIWTKIEFWVSYESDLQQVKGIAIDSAKRSTFFSAFEDPSFWVMTMEKDAYKCWLAAWADSPASAWELGNDVRTILITEFQKFNIQSHGFIIDLKQKYHGQSI